MINDDDFIPACELPTPTTKNALPFVGVVVCWIITRGTDFMLHDTSQQGCRLNLAHEHVRSHGTGGPVSAPDKEDLIRGCFPRA
jgi:hypothetical protein